MNLSKQDISSDESQCVNRGEPVSLMEPLYISVDSRFRDSLNDLAIELVAKSTGFCKGMPQKLIPALANLVRGMNCYYSNLIEGHDTHPVDIERALKNDYSNNVHKRNLQLEARAHIKVQTWIDEGGLADQAATSSGLLEIHRRFCAFLPEDLLWVDGAENKTRIRVSPGTLRKRDVIVGRHIPVSPGVIPVFLEKFGNTYAKSGKLETILYI